VSNVNPENVCPGSDARVMTSNTQAYVNRRYCTHCQRNGIRVKVGGKLYLHSKKEH
jgi:hypothetical protein